MRTFTYWICVFAVMLGSMPVFAAEPEKEEIFNTPMLQVTSDDITIGSIAAPVTIIEYASLSCPHCGRYHNNVFPEVKKQFIDTGKARYVYRHFPLNKEALRAAMLVNCAGRERGETLIAVLFKSQNKWAYDSKFPQVLKDIARVGGISDFDFDACMQNKAIEDQVILTRHNAEKELKIGATPTFFINGKKMKGERSVQDFANEIAAAMKRPR